MPSNSCYKLLHCPDEASKEETDAGKSSKDIRKEDEDEDSSSSGASSSNEENEDLEI